MRKILLVFVLFAAIKSKAQINPFSKERIGDTITINGRIYAGNFLKNVISKPTFLNVFDDNPSRMLMLRIDSGDRKNFPDAPEKYYLDKKVSIRGILSDYKGVALIKIMGASEVAVDVYDKGAEPVNETGRYMAGKEFGFGKADSIFRSKQDSVKAIIAADTTRRRKQFIQRNVIIDTVKKAVDTVVIAKEIPAIDILQPVITDTAKIKRTDIVEMQQMDTLTDDKPDVVRQIRIKNVPIIKRNDENKTDSTSSKAEWLKTVSSQHFEPVINEVRTVKEAEIEMRTSPNADAPVLAYLMKQMTVRITFKSDKWSYVTVENPDGTIGLSGFIKNRFYKYLLKK